NPVTGTLTAVPGSPFADAGAPSALLMDSVGLYLFAANAAANEIGIFNVNGDGSLSFLRSVRSRSGPASLVATQGARPRHLPMFAEIASNPAGGGSSSYSVDPASGGLSLVDTAPTGPEGSSA